MRIGKELILHFLRMCNTENVIVCCSSEEFIVASVEASRIIEVFVCYSGSPMEQPHKEALILNRESLIEAIDKLEGETVEPVDGSHLWGEGADGPIDLDNILVSKDSGARKIMLLIRAILANSILGFPRMTVTNPVSGTPVVNMPIPSDSTGIPGCLRFTIEFNNDNLSQPISGLFRGSTGY